MEWDPSNQRGKCVACTYIRKEKRDGGRDGEREGRRKVGKEKKKGRGERSDFSV